MSTLYALLVGINRYAAPHVGDLHGCVPDVEDAQAFLTTRAAGGTEPRIEVLRDGEATRAAVIDGLRSHLGQAGPGDTALFWFAGHGSQAPVPDWAWFEEPTGWLQTLVCHDSRTADVPDLWDKELSVLLDEIADRRCHLAVVLDSCHSSGATRELVEREPAARVRSVRPVSERARASLLPQLEARVLDPPVTPAPEHVALAACRSFETAQEKPLGGRPHGVFSWALIQALARLGATATYRDLLVATQTEVALRADRQVPQVSPPTPGLADQPFLGGAVRTPGAGIVMRYARDGWEVDAGSAHGLPVTGGVTVGVPGSRPMREAAVVRVLTERSVVEPAGGWQPDRRQQPRVVLTGVPFPRTTVEAGDPRVLAALRTAGPGGGPSPHVRAIPPGDITEVPDLRVVVEPSGVARIFEHGTPLDVDVADLDGGGAQLCVAALEHIARWRQVRDLANPVSRLTGAVRVEIVAAPDGVARAPQTGPVLAPDGEGVHRLWYRRGPEGWKPPHVFVRLRNTGARPLFCVLLNLTGRFRVHAALFPGDFVGAGRAAAAVRGGRIEVKLPPGADPEPGRQVRDWLKLIVAEEQFGADPFALPDLGGHVRRGPRGALAVRGLIERLGGRAVHRDLAVVEQEPLAYDWTTDLIPLVTGVPR